MDEDLQELLSEIERNTGLHISAEETVSLPAEEDGNRTSFRITRAGRTYVCTLEGAGEEQKKYVYFLAKMLERTLPAADPMPDRETGFRRIFSGGYGEEDLRRFRARHGIPDKPFFVLIVPADGRESDYVSLLDQYGEDESDYAFGYEGDCVLIKFVSEDSEYRSSADFAQFLAESFLEELGASVAVGVGGTCRRLEDAPVSYRQARAALDYAAAAGEKAGVFTYREFALNKIIGELPVSRREEYMSVLLEGRGREILKDEDLMSTAEAFLNNSLNISETSRSLYMHRNTLIYRLDKLEKMTGLNLRNFSDAVTFRVITILNDLL